MILTCIMVTKHRKWYLQMSVTLSIPILLAWVCLLLTSIFSRRCHQARKVENSYFDLTCDVISDLQIKFSTLYGKFGLSNGVWNLEISPVVWEISSFAPFPPAGRVTNQTPAGRGLWIAAAIDSMAGETGGTGRELPLWDPLIPFPGWDSGGPKV